MPILLERRLAEEDGMWYIEQYENCKCGTCHEDKHWNRAGAPFRNKDDAVSLIEASNKTLRNLGNA